MRDRYFSMLASILLIIFVIPLSGCGTKHWSEDVQLGDGSVITVKRKEKYGSWGGIGNFCWSCGFRNAEISFEYNGEIVHWESMKYSQAPMILDIRDSMPVLVTIPAWPDCPKHVSEDRSYVFYVYNLWKDGQWTELPKPPYEMVTDRNLHYYAPSSKTDLTIEAKKASVAWIRERKYARDYYLWMITDDATKHCRPWSDRSDRDVR